MHILNGLELELTDEQLAELEKLGSVATSFDDCAIILEIKTSVFLKQMKTKGSPVFNTYMKGFLQAEFEIKQSVFEMAKNGSSPAQNLALSAIESINIKRAINE